MSIGDELHGTLDDHGDAVLQNLSAGTDVEVYIEAIQATRTNAQRWLLGRL